MDDRFSKRRQKLFSAVKQACDAMLVTSETNVTYLTGFSGDSSYLLVIAEDAVLLTDSRYDIQIEQECPGLRAASRNSGETMKALVGKELKSAGVDRVGFESDHLTVATIESLKEGVSDTGAEVEWVAQPGKTSQLRMIKDKQEIAETRQAINIAERAFVMLRSMLDGEMTELQAAHELEHAMRRFGAEGAAFDPIVAVGAWAALPHARPGKRQIKDDPLLLIDWGAEVTSRYRSDQTRVLFTGKPSKKHEKIYNVVLEAHNAGVEAIGPGVKASEVDRAARSVIEAAGYGPKFGHGLGHGFGLQIHEDPRMSRLCDTELKPGMLVTVEPGIYISGWGGFRIEDDILVTRSGHENLCSLPTDFEWAIGPAC